MLSKPRLRFGVEKLIGDGVGLAQDFRAIFGVCIVAKVGPFIDKALHLGIHDDTERMGLLGEPIGQLAVAGWRCGGVPGNGVATAPVPMGLGAYTLLYLLASTQWTS
jgi:hypothetical protein